MLKTPFYTYTDKEMKSLLATLTILVDTREQRNDHILQFFEQRQISYQIKKLDVGDYSPMIPANPELGIFRDLYFPIVIERKNSVDELASSIKDRSRFTNELLRAEKLNFSLIVEEISGYAAIVMGQYRSQYNPKALLASLKALESRYGFSTIFVSENFSGHFIYHHLLYQARNLLKGG